MRPLISIVTPSFNQGKYLEQTIKSVLNQNYEDKEYIIIDGGSTDNSVEIIKKYNENIGYWCSEKDKGQSDAINKGWKKSNGNIIAYLNSDDTLGENALAKVADYFEKHPNVGIIYGDCAVIDEIGNIIGIKKGKPLTYRKLLKYGQRGISQPAAFFNAKIVKQVGYLNTQWHYSMDYDLILKIAKVSKIIYIPETLASYRIHTNTKSYSQTEIHWQETFRVRKQYSKNYPISMKLNYLKFKLLSFTPTHLENIVRKIRNTPRDQVYLKNKKNER